MIDRADLNAVCTRRGWLAGLALLGLGSLGAETGQARPSIDPAEARRSWPGSMPPGWGTPDRARPTITLRSATPPTTSAWGRLRSPKGSARRFKNTS